MCGQVCKTNGSSIWNGYDPEEIISNGLIQLRCLNIQIVSGAVGTPHRQRSMASMTRTRDSESSASPSRVSSVLSKLRYRSTSSTFCPLHPHTRHPSTSPSQGLVTLSNQPASGLSSPRGGGAEYALAWGNIARWIPC